MRGFFVLYCFADAFKLIIDLKILSQCFFLVILNALNLTNFHFMALQICLISLERIEVSTTGLRYDQSFFLLQIH